MRRGAVCVFCRGWAREPVVVGRNADGSGPGWAQYAHRECAVVHRRPPLDEEDQAVPAAVERGAEGHRRHRRERRVLEDLPWWMPGGLVAAFGVARRHAAAVVLAVVVWPVPAWLVAPQAVDTLTAVEPDQVSPELSA